ncbi:hypothetical protein [Bradyrhizobium elkanii]|jgi:hypothetical protein|uniref:hypothetical protein n=1 Tax=Bradyrhizobium elkanii TaxID=29448 RepID=UPI000483D5A7|nr:hypothetical protein [Bradyrhizobium elkanii]MCS3448119.1 hypothetical protein [Bradyrhizobium elkanii]MCS3560742.1 hypothetical protein [Bradyrhizobium elkanii]MCW2149415.1 hypothetical protein [Bradyrhizobium elkanii]MCW2373144.1 hypothetical protein [Bradyrhizobium elkanii]WLB03089.1 hypothetical protein QNJ80_14345 [Bradyrhizobium elkanii]
MLTRRLFLALGSAGALSYTVTRTLAAQQVATRTDRPLVGALRWDAWYAPGSTPTKAVETSLSPQQYHWRVPFFAKETTGKSRSEIAFPEITQQTIDKEIKQAVFAGIDYWAFVAYGSADPMSRALKIFRESPIKNEISYCIFTEFPRWGSHDKVSPLIDEHVKLMGDSNYLKVAGGRPLYFLGFIHIADVEKRWGGFENLRAQIEQFRARVKAAGHGDPYLVLTGDKKLLNEQGAFLTADAVSSYAGVYGSVRGSYADLTRGAERDWNELAKSRLPVIPTVMTGWDRRPRIERPVPWEAKQRPGVGMENFFIAPTGAELSDHLHRSIEWRAAQPGEMKSPAILIYAWNENDEGGWLVPTLPCKTERLEALRKVLKDPQSKQRPNLC